MFSIELKPLHFWFTKPLKILVVFNPNARSGRSRDQLDVIRNAFVRRSVDAEFVLTRKAGHATQLVAEAQLDNFDCVVAVGGDGTIFEVLNGLFTHQKSAQIPLAMIPAGTGNAVAREFDLFPSNWEEAVDRIVIGKTRTMDVGHAKTDDDSFYFLNIIGMGFVVDAGITSKKLKFIGNAAYTLGTLWETFRLKTYPLVMELDGQQANQENIFIEISNTRYTGTSFLIAPDAEIDDGLLDIILLKKLSSFRLLKLFPTIYSGRHVEFDEIETCQAKIIRLESPVGMPLTVDGEFRGQTPVEIRCLPGALQLMV